jgi:hypothetical protein
LAQAKRAALGAAIAPLTLIIGLGGAGLIVFLRMFGITRSDVSRFDGSDAFLILAGVQLIAGGALVVALFRRGVLARVLYWAWMTAMGAQFALAWLTPLAHPGTALIEAGVIGLVIIIGRTLMRLDSMAFSAA